MTNFTDYIPHAAVAALTAVVAWVGRDHFQRDDTRFKYMSDAIKNIEDKLDAAADNMVKRQEEAARDVANKLDRVNERQASALQAVSNKLDSAITTQSENHAEILKLLIVPVRDRPGQL